MKFSKQVGIAVETHYLMFASKIFTKAFILLWTDCWLYSL